MMRYRGKFSRSAYPDIVIYPSDEGKVLDDKWKRWYQLESWKRYGARPTQPVPSNFSHPGSSSTPTCATPKSR